MPPKSLTFWGHLIFKRHFLSRPSRHRRAVRGEEALSEILILLFVRFFVIIFIVPKRTTHCSSIAQLVEQSAVNRSVVGSSPTRGANFISWPVGQAVKTPPFHGGIPGSIPGRVTTWTISSAGRAPALQAGCRQFDPVIVHQTKEASY